MVCVGGGGRAGGGGGGERRCRVFVAAPLLLRPRRQPPPPPLARFFLPRLARSLPLAHSFLSFFIFFFFFSPSPPPHHPPPPPPPPLTKTKREALWIHALEGGLPELGGLLVATPEAVSLTGDERRSQLVCYVTKHDPQQGSVALILNRPATAALGDLLGWGLRFGGGGGGRDDDDDDEEEGRPSTSSSSSSVEAAFGDSTVYLGGFFSPARIAAQPLTLLHGIPDLPGAAEVVPGGGVFGGGVAAAAAAVASGQQPVSRCRLFAGALVWPPGGLRAEVEGGVWFAAASSRAVVLKPCLGLPVPLWRECLGLMGGEYAKAARRRG